MWFSVHSHDLRMIVEHDVSKHWQFVIDEPAKVTLDYTYINQSDICSKFYMECVYLIALIHWVLNQKCLSHAYPEYSNCSEV